MTDEKQQDPGYYKRKSRQYSPKIIDIKKARTMIAGTQTNDNNIPIEYVLEYSSTPGIESSNIDYKINPTPDEEKLFTTLLSAADAYHAKGGKTRLRSNESEISSTLSSSDHTSSSVSSNSPVSIRVAGGWVRDKILGYDSHDIDIALDCLSGADFAEIVSSYLDGIEDHAKHKVSIINANPDQSKHLETATMRIFGMDVDFVNLRAEEVYEEDSRIPTHQTVMFGTPLEDALRRDITINSLFFNVRTSQVEDHTGRGLEDLLVTKLIETPVDPHVTFKDDPLRVLRAIRFGVRLHFTLAKDLQAAAMSKDIHKCLAIKVSRERVGKELDLMLTGKGANPIKALKWICDLGLGESVFGMPCGNIFGTICGSDYDENNSDNEDLITLREKGWKESAECISILPTVLDTFHSMPCAATQSIMDERLLHVSSFILPFGELHYKDKKQKDFRVIHWMIKEGVKFKNKDIQAVGVLFQNLGEMRSLIRRVFVNLNECSEESEMDGAQNELISRLEAGLLLRKAKDLWINCLLLATLAEIMSAESFQRSAVLQACTKTYQGIIRLKIEGCWKLRPLLDGKTIIKALDLPKGPLVGAYLEEQVRWMLSNPEGSEDECATYLKERKKERVKEDHIAVEKDNQKRGPSKKKSI